MTEFLNYVPERGFEAPRRLPRGEKGKRGTGLLPLFFILNFLIKYFGGDRETRTLTAFLPLAPEASASTNSAISPN